MKTLIAPIIGCVLTSSVGYWLSTDPTPETPAPPARITHRSVTSRTAPVPAAIVAAVAAVEPPPVAPTPVPAQNAPAPEPSRPLPVVIPAAAPQTEVATTELATRVVDATSATRPAAADGQPPMIASADDDLRFMPTTRPEVPVPQHPPEATTRNVDTDKPVAEWQRLTDDWGGLRPKLDDKGISLQASLTSDSSDVLSGGANPGATAFRNLFNANVTIDTEKLLGWKGGTFFANFQQKTGDNGSDDVGAIQSTSSMDADGRSQISELWYEQLFLGDKLRVRVGKVDANGDFAHAPDADEFMNAAFGAAQSILGMPTYPDPATSINVFVKPTDNLYVGGGVYDGSTQAGTNTGDYGPAKFLGGGSHTFYIAEAGTTWSLDKRDGRFSVGAWHHTASFDRLDGSGAEHGTSGEYVTLDQCLWRANPSKDDDKRGLGFFLKYGHADADVSPIEHQVSAGLALTGVFGRDDDVLGAALTCGLLSGRGAYNGGDETAYEVFYKFKLTEWLSIKPDVQYVHNPGGGGVAGDALVGNLRIVIDF